MRSRGESASVGKIFGRKVSLLEFRDALQATKNQMLIQFGDQSPEILKHINLESEAWDRLILLAEARKRKIKATDEEVTGLIQSYPFFKDRKAKFDNKIYNESLYYDFHTQARIFEEQIRQNLILAKLFDAVTEDIDLTEEELKEGYRKENERLSFYYIASVLSDKDKSREMAKQKIEECLQKLKEAYQVNPKSIDFNAFAKKFGLKSDSTVMLKYGSYVEGMGSSDIFWKAAWKLKEDELSEIIDMGPSGFYIIKLKSRLPIDENQFETEKSEFRQKLLAQKKWQYFSKFLGELKRRVQLF
jgi:hypothetical protein